MNLIGTNVQRIEKLYVYSLINSIKSQVYFWKPLSRSDMGYVK